ncbi:MAG: hypothetical protein M5R40_08385 [Anaerolineae bacterium]|nr:hypothetical protein [Anaerolineae bacterium]
MSGPDNLNQFKDVSAEEKLQILRSEMLTPIETIRAFADTMKKLLEKNDFAERREDIRSGLSTISDNANETQKTT